MVSKLNNYVIGALDLRHSYTAMHSVITFQECKVLLFKTWIRDIEAKN
jgi:hypothetical protein